MHNSVLVKQHPITLGAESGYPWCLCTTVCNAANWQICAGTCPQESL